MVFTQVLYIHHGIYAIHQYAIPWCYHFMSSSSFLNKKIYSGNTMVDFLEPNQTVNTSAMPN